MTPQARPDAGAVADLVRRLGEAMASSDATAGAVAAVAGGPTSDDGAPLAVHALADAPGIEKVTVTRRWESEEPNAAEITLRPGLQLSELEEQIGPARAVPRKKPGRRRVVLDGSESRWTTLASVEEGGGVRSVTVVRDE